MFLMAAGDLLRREQAESADQRVKYLRSALSWNRSAEECCGDEPVPGAFWSQRYEILNLLGEQPASAEVC